MVAPKAAAAGLTPAAKLLARASLLYAALATVLCAPVLSDPVHLALGHPGNDVWNHVWGYWWVARSLASGAMPIHTDLLGWPHGGSLWFIDFFNAVLTLPVQWVAGPVAAYNAGIWLNLVLCGVGCHALAHRVTGSRAGAVLGGVAYMTAPHLLAQVYNGISETVGAGWLPLAVLALREAVRAPSARRGAIAGAAVAVTAVANWYYGLFAGIVLAGLLTREAARALGRRARRSRLAAGATAMLTGGVTAAALAVVPFGLFAQSMGAPDALVTRDPGFVWMTLVMHNMTDALTLVHPGKFYSPDLHALFGEDLVVVVYLGAALWVPAIGLYFTRTARAAEAWGALLAVFLLLSLGPFLYVGGEYVGVRGGWLPLPFLALFEWFPMFSRISHAYRFTVGSTLALCVLVAFVVKAAPRYGYSATGVALAIGVVRVIEAWFASPAIFPLPVSEVRIPAVYKLVTDGAIIDLPVTMPVLARSQVLVNQLVHARPIPFGLNDPVPKVLHENHYTHYIVALERRSSMFLPPEMPIVDLVAGKLGLVEMGCRWIAVHKDAYTADQYARVAHFLDLTARAVADDGTVRLYDLAAPLDDLAEAPDAPTPAK